MRRFTLGLFAILGIMTVTQASPHHRDDPYSPVIDFLKQLRKARKHSGAGGVSSAASGIFPGASSGSSSLPSGIFGGGSGGGRDVENIPAESQTSTPILFPSGGSSSSGSSSSSGGNSDRITIQLPSNLQPNLNRPPSSSSPQDIQRINSGVSTILSGVRSFDLGQILRGAFIFPANNNVKSVANNVLDSIFGPAGGQPPAQN